MTITGQPIGASAGTPSYTAQQSRQAFSAHLANGSARILGCVSGYTPGRMPTTLTVNTTTWTIGAFACIIDAAFTTTQAPYEFAVDANVTGSIVAQGGSPRTDILYAQINDTDIDASGLRTATVNYVSSTSVAPARSFLLATISVPASGGGSPTIAVNPTFAVAAGGIRPVSGVAAYPATSFEGDYVDDATTNSLVRYNGAAWDGVWTSYTPTFTNMSVGSGTVLGKYMVWNKTMFLRAGITFNGTTISSTLGISLPAGYTAVSDGFEQDIQVYCLVSGATVFAGLAGIPAGGSAFTVIRIPSSSSVTTLAAIAATGGFVNGSQIIISGMIQVA